VYFSKRLAAVLTAVACIMVGVTILSPRYEGLQAQAQTTMPPDQDDACAKLAGVNLDHGEITIARTQPAQIPVAGVRMPGMSGTPGEGPPVAGLPSFCRVAGHLHPEPGSDINFEVWLPTQGWDGRLNGAGNGGFAGFIAYLELSRAVAAGQVGASTDTGHAASNMNSAWAKGHPERVRDYGWRAIHLTAVVAKQLIASFYGRGPDHSYFMACSNGGRQALMEASRFPQDYDGILAGAPASVITDLAMSMINTVQAQTPDGAAFRPEQAKLLSEEVLRQCDGLDGQVDGLVDDPRMCKVDVTKLACGTSASPQCFSPAQIVALRRIYAGPHNAAGKPVAFGYPASGAEVGVPMFFGWDGWIFRGGKSLPYPLGHQHELLASGLLQDLAPQPIATVQTFDFDKDPARLKAALSGDLDAKPDLRAFFDRGGKLIIYHGWADGAIPPQMSIAYYERALRSSGAKAKDSMRLIMVPGMQHCFGGPGADDFGQLYAPMPSDTPDKNIGAAIQSWVETGRKPESLIGQRGLGPMAALVPQAKGPVGQRLLCAYPAKAVLNAGADPDQASSYVCRSAMSSRKAKSSG
jgi:feruloyl esterase